MIYYCLKGQAKELDIIVKILYDKYMSKREVYG